MSIDYSDAVGFPATAAPVRKRRLPPGSIGKLVKRGGTGAKDPGTEEMGWLTPMRPSVNGGYHWFKCRCGAEVVKAARQVRNSHRAGRVCRCGPACKYREAK